MSLPTGNYYTYSVSFATGEPVSRPLGEGQSIVGAQVVVLSLGTPPPQWHIEQLSDGQFTITLGGKNARVVDGALQLSTELPPFEWEIIRGAPSPPPIGTNSFGIIVRDQQPQQSWLIPSTEGDQAVEVPVTIGQTASSIVIVPVEQ